MTREIELNHEFVGLSDAAALQVEIDDLHTQLDSSTSQLALERDLAIGILKARSRAISESSALRLVFGADDDDSLRGKPDIAIDDILSSAFVREITSGELPEGFADTVAKNLLIANHPDAGGDPQVSQDIAHRLSKLKEDPTFSIASALLAAPKGSGEDIDIQRAERYRLHITLSGARPQFDNEEEAKRSAEVEMKGAEWRVRTQAAFKSLELIIGDDDTWNQFLESIVRTQHTYLIHMVNRLQPAMLRLEERLAKGDPITAESLDTPAIDAIFEKIWSTLDKKDTSIPYSPPYQNWLEILLPAMELLDPGEKLGEEYTHFEPPIQARQTPSYASRYDRGREKDYPNNSYHDSY